MQTLDLLAIGSIVLGVGYLIISTYLTYRKRKNYNNKFY